MPSTVCVGDSWTGVNDCGISLGTVVGTKTTGTCAAACTPVTETWTSTHPDSPISSPHTPNATHYCSDITWTGTETCPGDPDVALGTVTGTQAASHLWSSSGLTSQTTTPVAADYCPDITWTDTATCTTAAADIVGTKNSGEQWVHGDNSQANKPVASEVCVGITWTGSNDCGSLGTVVGTKTDEHCDEDVSLGWSAPFIDTSQPVSEVCPDNSDPPGSLLYPSGYECTTEGAVHTDTAAEVIGCSVAGLPYQVTGYRYATYQQVCEVIN